MGVDLNKCERKGCNNPGMRMVATPEKSEWLCYPHAEERLNGEAR